MALFGKKKDAEYCAICGKERKTGLFRGLFQAEVDGQYVCNDCFGDIDIDSDIMKQMTIPAFKEYIQFREENTKLKNQFTVTNTIDLGILDTKIVFDQVHGYIAFSKELDKTIFERKHLVSFLIKEDDHVIFEGDANGLQSYGSNVYNRLRMMQRQFAEYRQEMIAYDNRASRMTAEERNNGAGQRPTFAASEPFLNFNIELYFDHPYRKKLHFDMTGPRFSNGTAFVEENYRNEYKASFDLMEQLANNLKSFVSRNSGAGTSSVSAGNAAPQEDVMETLKRLKELVDMGVVTEEEFTAKKRQLLGL